MGDESEGNRRPYMRLWISDARSSCMVMSAAQFGAHMRMLMWGWEHGYVPAEECKLRMIVGPIDWADMAEVLERWRKVTMPNGRDGYVNARQERERERMEHEADKRRRSGRKGASSRWDGKDDGKPHGKEDGKDHGTNMAFPYSHTPILPDSQTPRHPDSDDLCSDATVRARTIDALSWSVDGGWTGITDKDRSDWAVAYPAVNIDQDLAKAHQWLLGRPAKQRKKRWRAFLTNWMSGTQERGGSRGGFQPRGPVRDESHIPEDVHPDDRCLFWTPDGKPRRPPVWRRRDGTWNV